MHPSVQRQGVGTAMLRTLVSEHNPGYLATYTRSPAIIKMIQKESSAVYPLVDDEELHGMAASMSHATHIDAAYHVNRYGEEGLFVGEDPADSPLESGATPLKQQFSGLASARNALILAARVRK